MYNEDIQALDLMRKLLHRFEIDTIISQLRTTSDVELLLDFIVHVCISLLS